MSEYAYVSVPFAGSVSVRVKTEGCTSCAQVVDRAVKQVSAAIYLAIDPDEDTGDIEPLEICALTKVVGGNVCYAPLHEAGIEYYEDEE